MPEPVIRRLLRRVKPHSSRPRTSSTRASSRRTIQGVARALGLAARVDSPLSGVNSEVVLTFAWEITWYQYRVLPEANQPIRLADRGADIAEIEPAFTSWNAQLDDNGRVIPDVAR